MNSNLKKLTVSGVMAALLCVVAPFSINIGPVPLTLATLVIYLAAALLGSRLSTAAVAVYLALGAIGLPVFSGFSGGPSKLIGPTGGFLVGYLFLAFLSGLGKKNLRSRIIMMAIGTFVMYTVGVAWFMIAFKATIGTALLTCVLPFIPGDIVKMIFAAFLTEKLHFFGKIKENT